MDIRKERQTGFHTRPGHIRTPLPGHTFPGLFRVLEAGCRTGSLTCIVIGSPPATDIILVDTSRGLPRPDMEKTGEADRTSRPFVQGDIFNLSFRECTSDHNFACFVLESTCETPEKPSSPWKDIFHQAGRAP